GGLNIAEVEGPDIQRLLSSHKLTYRKGLNYLPLILVFNEARSPFNTDTLLRKAIATAVDPAQFNQAAYGGAAEVTPSVFRPEAPCFDKNTYSLVPKPSISAAQQILAQ